MLVRQKRFHFFRLGRCYDSMTPLATNKIEVQVPLLNLRVEREAEADDADKLITILISSLYFTLGNLLLTR